MCTSCGVYVVCTSCGVYEYCSVQCECVHHVVFLWTIQLVRATSTAAQPTQRLKTFSIYRWDPDKEGDKPRMETFKVDLNT